MSAHAQRTRATAELIARRAEAGRLEPVMRPIRCASLVGVSVQDVCDAMPLLQEAGVIAMRDDVIELARRAPAEQLTIGE